MGSISEIGASDIKLDSYKCSIKEITVSALRKAPGTEASERAVAKVFDNHSSQKTKTIYLITSPEGEDVTIKTIREAGGCQREHHKKYRMLRDEYKKEEKQDATAGFPLIPPSMPMLPFIMKNSIQKIDCEIKNEETLSIKCFEIGGALETFKYFKLPIPLTPKNVTQFLYSSCKEGAFNYEIISYPDIKYKLEVTIGTKEAKKKQGGFSHFKREASYINNVPEKAVALYGEAFGTEVKFCPPSVTGLITYNGKNKDELEFLIDFDTDKEVLHFRYKHDSSEIEFGTEAVQNVSATLKKITDLCQLLKKICNVQFLKELFDFDASKLKAYKPYKFKLNTPSVSISFEGQYSTSKDLQKIGKVYDVCIACNPLVSLSLTIDILYLIISVLSSGTATGIYVMLKNFDEVLGKLLGSDYKKKYNETKPFEADIFINLVVTGAISGDVHEYIDTAEDKKTNSSSGLISGELKVDVEAGAKVGLDVLFFIDVEGEASASGSSGIKLSVGLKDRILQGEGLAAIFEIIFMGLKVKYCVKGKVGLAKTWSLGGSVVDGEKTIINQKTLLSARKVFLEDNRQIVGSK